MHGNAELGFTDFVRSLVADKCDPALGAQVREHLQNLGLETMKPAYYDPEVAYQALLDGVFQTIKNLGLDVNDPSLKDTPKRVAAMFVGELTKGLNYDFFPKATATPNGTEDSRWPHAINGTYNQMVLVANIQTTSLCEHHWQTIDGFTHIAYIPNRKVMGLSKFARITDFFARRPQIQERMTEQVFAALSHILETDDIAVVQKCVHYCMRARGAQQSSSITTTDKMGGRFMTNTSLREEFLNAIG